MKAGTRRWLAALAVVVISTVVLTPIGGAGADAAEPAYEPQQPQVETVVPGGAIPPADVTIPPTGRAVVAPAPVWPTPGMVVVDLPPAEATPSGPGVRAGSLPVFVRNVGGVPDSAAPSQLRVRMLETSALAGAGFDGAVVRLERADGSSAAARVQVTVDYRTFRHASGGDWAARLRLVRRPVCALTTPAMAPCKSIHLRTTNDLAAGLVTALADVPVAAGADDGTLLSVESGPAGPAGSYAATTLQPSATWSAGGSAGGFSWSYPMRVPAALNGPTPTIALGYSSASVDGRMAASNNQPSIVGEGFDWSPGYIERRYVPCADDMADGARNTEQTGDLCWKTDNATLSLNGGAAELLKGGDGKWHLRTEDGSRVERRTGAANGDNDGEHWVVTTTDGTQYWFGLNRPPGWTSGAAVTGSTLVSRVYGNHASEPCAAATFAASHCNQAWRWNLDWVVDPRGNAMSLWWSKETNAYAANNNPQALVGYDRAGFVTRVDYGQRSNSAYVTPPMRVSLALGDRCTSSCTIRDEAHWPDTPFDQECTRAPCNVGSPTFWTTKRLRKITTQLWTGSGTTFRDVESWTLTHSFPDPGDGTRAGLWLDRISHAGGSDSVPDVVFTGVQLANRVDTIDHAPPMNWWRIAYITSESGGRIVVNYSGEDCVAGVKMPTHAHGNRLRCYPVRWTPPGATTAVTDHFHKYVVDDVTESDLTGASPDDKVTHYDYVGDPGWHYTDDDGLVKAEDKTWSVWRGYGTVRRTVGGPGEQMATTTTYFRGMHGDRQPSGSAPRTVVLPASGGAPAVADEDAYAGLARESTTSNGTAVVSTTITEPWQSAATATRSLNGSTVTARFTRAAATWTRTARDGGRADMVTLSRSTFDALGMTTKVEDLGDTTVAGDERCTLTDYARNGTAWLMSTVSRIRALAVNCTQAGQGGLTEGDWIGDTRTSYDHRAFGAAPDRGLVTKVEVPNAWNPTTQTATYLTTSTAQHDPYGRVTQATDVRGNTTTTEFTPSSDRPVTSTTAVNHRGWKTTTTVEPAWGSPTAIVDPNGRRTELTYDGLGRPRAVWLPGRDKAAGASASMTYAYLVRTDAPSAVTTSTIGPNGGYVTTFALVDGLLRPRQTQTPESGPQGGRIITDTHYDTAGRVAKTYGSYVADGPPGTTLFRPVGDNAVPSIIVKEFDGAGRETDGIFLIKGIEQWRTRTGYGGDRTDVTPPAGGTATSTLVDARGRKTALRQYHGSTPAGTFDLTGYSYNNKDQLEKVTDPADNTWTYGYDLMGRQARADDPDKGRTTSVYNDVGDLTSTTDSRGVTLSYTYDDLGRKTSLRDGAVTGPKLAEWAFDPVIGGVPVRGQLGRSTRWVGSAAYVTETTGFAADYQPTRVVYTIPAAEGALAGSYAYDHTYKPNGAPATVNLPDVDGSGGLTAERLTYGYDTITGAAHSLRTNYGGADVPYVVGSTYTRYGELAVTTLATAGTRMVQIGSYYAEGTRRLERVWTTRESAPSTVSDRRYHYSPAGDVTKLADLTSADHQCFGYDHLRRLTEAWTPAGGDCTVTRSVGALGGPARYWSSWTFDAVGNRRTQTELNAAGAARATTTYTYPTATTAQPHTLRTTTGAATGTYTYDEAGNTRTRPAAGGGQTLTWDQEGRLATATDSSGSTSFLYDATGNRLIRRDPTGATLYLPHQELRTTTTGARSTTRYYSHTGQTRAMRTTSGLTWLTADHHGTAQHSIAAMTQAVTTRLQGPYGTARGSDGPWSNDKGFVGGTTDNTGLVHLGAREYDPANGRFVSVDPIIDYNDPQQMHGYAYANNTPVTASDPDGLCVRLDDQNAPCLGSANYAQRQRAFELKQRGFMGPSVSDLRKPTPRVEQRGFMGPSVSDLRKPTRVDSFTANCQIPVYMSAPRDAQGRVIGEATITSIPDQPPLFVRFTGCVGYGFCPEYIEHDSGEWKLRLAKEKSGGFSIAATRGVYSVPANQIGPANSICAYYGIGGCYNWGRTTGGDSWWGIEAGVGIGVSVGWTGKLEFKGSR